MSGRESVSTLAIREVRGHYWLGGAGQGERNMDWWRDKWEKLGFGKPQSESSSSEEGSATADGV